MLAAAAIAVAVAVQAVASIALPRAGMVAVLRAKAAAAQRQVISVWPAPLL